jgi:hypothetical protein
VGKNITIAVLFGNTTNWQILIKILSAVFEKNYVL